MQKLSAGVLVRVRMAVKQGSQRYEIGLMEYEMVACTAWGDVAVDLVHNVRARVDAPVLT